MRVRRLLRENLVSLGIIGLWLIWCLGILLHGNGVNVAAQLGFSSFDFEKAGQFGDAFGSLGSLMAALAAAGAWHALGQARRQSFESTFYSLLSHLNQIVIATDIQGKKRVKDNDGKTILENTDNHVGKDAFRRLLRSLRLTVAGMKSLTPEQRVVDGYKRFYDKHTDDLAHYFRIIYNIVCFIDNSSAVDKKFYAGVLRAQMSDSEQILLMYNCSVGKGRDKFKSLVEKYSMLHNCSKNDLDDHWENSILRPSFVRNAFRDDETELWPTPDDLKNDILKSSLSKAEEA